MEKYLINQRGLFDKTVYENQSSITVTIKKLSEMFKRSHVPTKHTFDWALNRFKKSSLHLIVPSVAANY